MPGELRFGSISFLGQPAEFLLEERDHVGTPGRLACVVAGSAIAQLPTQNGPERSTLLECALRLIAQGLDKIRQRGSTRRLDEDVDRHAGHQLG